jgi:hypothetical protein
VGVVGRDAIGDDNETDSGVESGGTGVGLQVVEDFHWFLEDVATGGLLLDEAVDGGGELLFLLLAALHAGVESVIGSQLYKQYSLDVLINGREEG